jgi:DNA-binding transcriptional LysR family regulator
VYAEEGVPVPWRLRGPGGEVAVKLRGRVRASNSEALMELMLAGVGLGYPPSFASAAHIRAGRLRPVLTAWSEETVPLYLAWPPGRNQDPKVRAFLDYLVERLGNDGRWEPELAPTASEVTEVAAKPPTPRRRKAQR